MADVFSAEKRSQVMAAIRSKDTKPEMAVRRMLHAMGLRFRLHVAALPGRPDIVLKRLEAIIQVKGCFWHGHRCLKGRIPRMNRSYWRAKIAGNKARDKRNERQLRTMGWSVKTVWECCVRRSDPDELSALLARMLDGCPRRMAQRQRSRRPRRSTPRSVLRSCSGTRRAGPALRRFSKDAP